MLPVLILARSLRQRDYWQHAVEAAALKLRLDPLAGALACFPPEESARVNPWLLNWRALATEVSCHLQERLVPLPREAFPRSLSMEAVCDAQLQSNVAARAVYSGASTRLSRLVIGGLDKRIAQITQIGLEEREMVSLLGLRLTSCQWSILHLLLAHPLLSDEELASLLGLARKSVRCSLYELHQLGCLEPVMTEAGKRWHFCERGLRLIAAANHMHIRNIGFVPDDETGRVMSTMIKRGEAWLLQHIQHTAGIYSFFASLAQAARKEAGHELCWWETGAVCERRYQVAEQRYNLRPDALAEYHVGHQRYMRFWLEWDRGTMNVRDLAIKFSSYAHYIASREWARESSRLPVLICVAPDIAQERRMQRVAQVILAHTPGLVLWTATEVLLHEQGPLATIWLRDIPQSRQALQPGSSQRQCLFDAMLGKLCM
jgi:hypothetical protein